MNKAQKAYIKEYYLRNVEGYHARQTESDLSMFIEDFLEIDPKPDPDFYTCLTNRIVATNGNSFQEANKWLKDILRGTSANDVVTYERGKFLKTELNYFEIRKQE